MPRGGESPLGLWRKTPMPAPPPPYEKLALGFGVAIAAIAYVYWTSVGVARGGGWSSLAASRALVILGATVLLGLVLRLAVWANSDRS